MAGDRYVVLGLAHARSGWFREVARWATSAALPVEFVKCVSKEELRARLASSRPFSAVLVDGGLAGVDRDLLDVARAAGCAALVVDDGRVERDWRALGASAVLPGGFGRDDLVDALRAHAAVVGRADASLSSDDGVEIPAWRGRLVAVTGPGGTGASTAGAALAQALADDVSHAGMVLLADLALHADQAMLHDARDLVPGVQELVEAHRGGRPSIEEVRGLTFHVVERRYHLLLGLRRHRDWTAVRPRAFEAALDGLVRSFRAVVADVSPDVEGEDETGAVDVEERNTMARVALARADAVVVVGEPSMKGVHSLARLLSTLAGFGVDPARLVPVVNRAPRSPRSRAELAAALAALLPSLDGAAPAGPLFLPDRRRLDDAFRDGTRLPAPIGHVLEGAVGAVLERLDPAGPAPPDPVPVRPGSLGLS